MAAARPLDDLGLFADLPDDPYRVQAARMLPFLIEQESGGDPRAVSPKGAFGLGQTMPATARDPGFGVAPLQDDSPAEQERFAGDYLTAMLRRYGGDEGRALAAYNAGPGAVDRHGGIPPFRETQDYVRKITGRMAAAAPQRALGGRVLDFLVSPAGAEEAPGADDLGDFANLPDAEPASASPPPVVPVAADDLGEFANLPDAEPRHVGQEIPARPTLAPVVPAAADDLGDFANLPDADPAGGTPPVAGPAPASSTTVDSPPLALAVPHSPSATRLPTSPTAADLPPSPADELRQNLTAMGPLGAIAEAFVPESELARRQTAAAPKARLPHAVVADLEQGRTDFTEPEFLGVAQALERGQLENPAAVRNLFAGRVPKAGLKALDDAIAVHEAEREILNDPGNPLTGGLEPFVPGGRPGLHLAKKAIDAATLGLAQAQPEPTGRTDIDRLLKAQRQGERAVGQKIEELFPKANLAAELAGGALPYVGAAKLLRAARAAAGLAPVGEGEGAAIAEGAKLGGALEPIRRPEGAEDMTPGQELQARALQAAVGVTTGALLDFGVMKLGEFQGIVQGALKDKITRGALTKEAAAAGFDSPEEYVSSLTTVQKTADGLTIRPNPELAQGLPAEREARDAHPTEPDYPLPVQIGNLRRRGREWSFVEDTPAPAAEAARSKVEPTVPGGDAEPVRAEAPAAGEGFAEAGLNRTGETVGTGRPGDSVLADTEAGISAETPETRGPARTWRTAADEAEELEQFAATTRQAGVRQRLRFDAAALRAEAEALRAGTEPKLSPRERSRRGRLVDPENDDLITAIRKLGGIDVATETDWAGRLSHLPRTGFGLPAVEQFTGKGRTLDDLAEVLHEHGYLAGRDVRELEGKLDLAETGALVWSLGKSGFEAPRPPRREENVAGGMNAPPGPEPVRGAHPTDYADPFGMGGRPGSEDWLRESADVPEPAPHPATAERIRELAEALDRREEGLGTDTVERLAIREASDDDIVAELEDLLRIREQAPKGPDAVRDAYPTDSPGAEPRGKAAPETGRPSPQRLAFSGREFGITLSVKELVDKARDFARSHFAGKTVTVKSDGANVTIPWQGIKHTFSGKVSEAAAIVAHKLDRLIEEGRLSETVPDHSGRGTIKAVHYYDTPVAIGDRPATIRVVVRETLDGKRFYDHFEVAGSPADGLSGERSGSGSHQPTSAGLVPGGKAQDDLNISQSPGTFHANPYLADAWSLAKDIGTEIWNHPKQAAATAVLGAAAGAEFSNAEPGEKKWWLDVATGAVALMALRQRVPALGAAIEKLPLMGRGPLDLRQLKRRQQNMRTIFDRQTAEVGKFLQQHFTPSERAMMADLIETKGIVPDLNLVHRQAAELDAYLSYAGAKMRQLGMLAEDQELGGYLHRYYDKHLDAVLTLARRKPWRDTLMGTYTLGRGTEDPFGREYFSPGAQGLLKELDEIQTQIPALEKKARTVAADGSPATIDDLFGDLERLRSRRKEIGKIELAEYLGEENGQPKSYFFLKDEAPRADAGVTPVKAYEFRPGAGEKALGSAIPTAPVADLSPTDRVWTLRGTDPEKAVLHRDWTEAERFAWGEIKDVGYRYVRGMAEVSHDLSLATLFDTVAKRTDWVSDTAREGWEEVPSAGIGHGSPLRKYGALAGKWVRPDVWAGIKDHGRSPLGNHPLVKVYRNALAKWKLWHTADNPVTHFNNTYSNAEMLFLAGYGPKDLVAAIGHMRKGEASKLWREARDNGLFGTDWTTSLLADEGGGSLTLKDLAEELRTQPEIPDATLVTTKLMDLKRWWLDSKHAIGAAKGPWKTGAELARAFALPPLKAAGKPYAAYSRLMRRGYRFEDNVFKLAVYAAERRKGMAPSRAMDQAEHYFFDYYDVPQAIRIARDLPLGAPFISYPYLAVQAFAKHLVERPERLLGLLAGYEALNFAAVQATSDGAAPGDYWALDRAEDLLSAPWDRGRSLTGVRGMLHLPSPEGYRLALGRAHALGNPFGTEAGGKQKNPPLPVIGGLWGPSWYGGNPFMGAFVDVISNEDWKGKPIYHDKDPAKVKTAKVADYLYQAFAPPAPVVPGSYHQRKILEGLANDAATARKAGRNSLAAPIVDAANGVAEALGLQQLTGLDRAGHPILTRDAILGSVGIKLRPEHYDEGLEFGLHDLQKERQAVRSRLREKERLADAGRNTPAQLREARAVYDRDLAAIDAREDKLYQAAATLRRAGRMR